jgi:DNA invertase Pin-like site-specific DNA recombinase
MESDPTEAVPYFRVSTDEQANGQDAQLDACSIYCARLGWSMGEPGVDDDVSGALPLDKRPGMLDALGRLKRGGVLLVAKRDRLGRDPFVVAMIEAAVKRQKGRVVSVAGEGTDGDDPTSVLMRRIIDAFAEYERLIIRSRTKAALGAMRRRNRRTGGVPLGYDLADDGGRSKRGDLPNLLVENPAELATLATIAELWAGGKKAGGRSFRDVAAELDKLGVPTKTGAALWHHSTVAKLVNRTGG